LGLTVRPANDLEGADELLLTVVAKTLLAYKAYDANSRVIEALKASKQTIVIPERSQESMTMDYTKLVIE
jgi:hypothetical protein